MREVSPDPHHGMEIHQPDEREANEVNADLSPEGMLAFGILGAIENAVGEQGYYDSGANGQLDPQKRHDGNWVHATHKTEKMSLTDGTDNKRHTADVVVHETGKRGRRRSISVTVDRDNEGRVLATGINHALDGVQQRNFTQGRKGHKAQREIAKTIRQIDAAPKA